MNTTFEMMVQQATNYFVVVYLFRDVPWREKAPLRRVFDSRSCEGFNSYLRLMYQSVNFDFGQLYRAVSRHRNSSKAKALMEEKGIQVAQPKGKEKSYAAASGKGTAVDWSAFEEQMAALEGTRGGWAQWQAQLEGAAKAGEAEADEVISELAPELLVGLGDADFKPLCQWKADLPECAVATDEADIKLCTAGGGGMYCQDPRNSDYPWLPDPEQKLKETRAESLEGAGSAGRHGSSDAYVQREMAPSAPAPVTFDLQPQEIALFFF